MGWEAQLACLTRLSAQRPFRRRTAQLAWRGRHDDDSRDHWRCDKLFTTGNQFPAARHAPILCVAVWLHKTIDSALSPWNTSQSDGQNLQLVRERAATGQCASCRQRFVGCPGNLTALGRQNDAALFSLHEPDVTLPDLSSYRCYSTGVIPAMVLKSPKQLWVALY